VARCRWCGGAFVRVHTVQWRCESDACYERCLTHAILRREEPKEGESPYLFLPLPFQVDCIEADTTHLLVAGAAGISKSYFGRWLAYLLCRKVPGFQVLLLRCTFTDLERNHLQFMPKEAAQLGAKYAGGNVRKFEIFHENDETSVIWAGYCDDNTDVDRVVVGPEYDLIVLEEAVTLLPRAVNEIPPRARGSATARAAKLRMGLPLGGRSVALTNPGGRSMAQLIDFYIKREPDHDEYPHYRPDEFGYITGTLDDNPYLPEDYEAKSLSHLSAARYRQLRHGDWTALVGEFFAQYDESRHVGRIEDAA
jgi:phage terminase large subunit